MHPAKLGKTSQMLVRIRFSRHRVGRNSGKVRRVAQGVAALLSPAAALAAVLALWRVASDLNWAGRFAITEGLLSHWQVWLGFAILLQFCARVLARYAKTEQKAASR